MMKEIWILFFLLCCYQHGGKEMAIANVLYGGQPTMNREIRLIEKTEASKLNAFDFYKANRFSNHNNQELFSVPGLEQAGLTQLEMDSGMGSFKKDVLRARARRNVRSYVNVNCTSPLLSCKDRCMNERDAGGTQKLRCSCDPYCDYFQDCCADYVQYCLGQQSSNTSKTAMKVPDEQWTCRSGIWMIASCPQSWTNQDIKQSCISMRPMTADNYKDVLPVVTADNKTYANRFCAQCHGYNQRHLFQQYELKFDCLMTPSSKSKEKEKMKFLLEFCQKPSKEPRRHMRRRYCYFPEASCNDPSVGRGVRNKCLFGTYGLVYDTYSRLTFKNVYCGKCFRKVSNLLQCGPGEIPIVKNNPGKPLSVIMDIGNAPSKEERTQIFSCPKGKVYDVYLENCRQGTQVAPIKSSLIKYRVALWMKAIGHFMPFVYLFNETDFVSSYARAMKINSTTVTEVVINLLDPFQHIYLVEFDVDVTEHESNSSNNMLNNTRGLSKLLSAVIHSTRPFSLIINFYVFIIVKSTLKPLTCFETNAFSPSDYQVIPGTEASVYINQTGEVLGAREYFSTNQRIIKGKQVPVGQIVVCRQRPSVNCSGMYIFLLKHEYTIFANRSVLHKASGHLHEQGTYTWKNGTIMICTKFTATYKQGSQSVSDNNYKALTILTYIGFCVSVVCLLFVLVTYSVFADLRTIPGINLMNLCSALLVAQLLWLVGSGLTFTRLGCMVIAIVLHYSFLASFWWMSIIAFSTWRAFSGKASMRNYRNDRRQKQKRIARTMATGWLPLVMYVSICVALDRSETVTIGYGGEKGCWINNPRANLFFFAIPVGLSILWNAVFFVLIIKEIKSTIDQSKMVANRHHARQDSAVYARIAVLMGFTWVFGFVASFTSYYLMYPFVILNTLQGLYIAVAFGLTRRVRAFYKTGRKVIDSKSSMSHNKSTWNMQMDVESTKL